MKSVKCWESTLKHPINTPKSLTYSSKNVQRPKRDNLQTTKHMSDKLTVIILK